MTVADLVQTFTDGDLPIMVEAFDGSAAGSPTAGFTLKINNERAVRYLITAPGELGLARAYIAGDVELVGVHPADPYDALQAVNRWRLHKPGPRQLPDVLHNLRLRHLKPPTPPAQEAPPRARRIGSGLRHSFNRDAAAISKHYDVSNAFYEHVLGPSMTYTCAVFTDPDDDLQQAQEAKFDLVARKLALEPGARLLDVGCGWGSMAMHAAKNYGANVLAVTLSRMQADWAVSAVGRAGLSGQVRVLHDDYRNSPGLQYDAISSIGLLEHVGVKNYRSYFRYLYGKLRDGGRLLNHCITRKDNLAGVRAGPFIDRYVFPDAELASCGRIISAAHDAGFEVRHEENLREHYALTLSRWTANLTANWDACVAEVGPETARTWGLYMAASRAGFEANEIQLHQILAVKTSRSGDAAFPLRPSW